MPAVRTSTKMKVIIKHGGKTYPVEVDGSSSAMAFKQSIYRLTGVPADRMKVMVKGILKDDADMSKLGLKPDQVITVSCSVSRTDAKVVGTAGPLPEAPAKPVVFLEDMDDAELALSTRTPPGLINMGNTCYLNSTLQTLRVIPELQTALEGVSSGHSPENKLAMSVKNLYSGMTQTTEPVTPMALISNLRMLAPQFAETDQRGHYSQQDADEAWTQVVSALRATLPGESSESSFIDDWMSLELSKTMSTPEAPDEPPTTTKEKALKLECNISINTNFLLSGICDSLDQQVEKHSPTLDRSVMYTQKTRLSRMPRYLAVHLVRFYWRRDIQKKAKIMRKVKFPLQLDVLEIATDEERERLAPINAEVKQVLKARDERAKIAKRSKGKATSSDEKSEQQYRDEESSAVAKLIAAAGGNTTGSNPSGMYELCAMITHKGASADSGHYIGWVRKDGELAPSGEEEWYKFDDDKVSSVPASKIQSLDGGGEDSVAYILLYRAIDV